MKKILILILPLLLVTSCTKETKPEVKEISCDEAKESNATIVDVRTKEEYNIAHINNSINIDVNNIAKIKDEITNLDEPIIVYCQSGRRSKEAASKLIDYGYKNVSNITNGISSCK